MKKFLVFLVALATLAGPLASPASAAYTYWIQVDGKAVLQHDAEVKNGGAGFICSGSSTTVHIGFTTALVPPSDFPQVILSWDGRIPSDPPSVVPATVSFAVAGGADVKSFDVTYTLPEGLDSWAYTMSLSATMVNSSGQATDSLFVQKQILVIDCTDKVTLYNLLMEALDVGIAIDWDDDMQRPARVTVTLPRLPRTTGRYAVNWGDHSPPQIVLTRPRYLWRESGTIGTRSFDAQQECVDYLNAGMGTGVSYECEEFDSGVVSVVPLDHDYVDLRGRLNADNTIFHPYSVYVSYAPLDSSQPYRIKGAAGIAAHRC